MVDAGLVFHIVTASVTALTQISASMVVPLLTDYAELNEPTSRHFDDLDADEPQPRSCRRLHGTQHIPQPAEINASFRANHRAGNLDGNQPETVTPTAAATPSSRASLTIGTNIGTSSAGNVSKPARAALRQPNRCCGDMSCRRATSDTTAPGAYDSATIRPLVATLQRRRHPTPTRISTRPAAPKRVIYMVDHMCEPICQSRLHLAAQIARYKVEQSSAYGLPSGK